MSDTINVLGYDLTPEQFAKAAQLGVLVARRKVLEDKVTQSEYKLNCAPAILAKRFPTASELGAEFFLMNHLQFRAAGLDTGPMTYRLAVSLDMYVKEAL